MPDLSQILINLLSTIIFIPINALILWAVIKLMFKLKDKKFLTALKTAAAAAAALFVVQQILGAFSRVVTASLQSPATVLATAAMIFAITISVTIAVNSYAIKLFYKEKTSKAFLVGTVWSIVTWIISLTIGVIIVGIVIALTFGTGPPVWALA